MNTLTKCSAPSRDILAGLIDCCHDSKMFVSQMGKFSRLEVRKLQSLNDIPAGEEL